MFNFKCLFLSLFEGHEKNYWVTSNWVSPIKSFLIWKLAVYFDRRILGATKINRLGSENSKYILEMWLFKKYVMKMTRLSNVLQSVVISFFSIDALIVLFYCYWLEESLLKFLWDVRKQNNFESKCYELIGRWF